VRVKSAYINNRIPLHIVPTVRDNRMLLHAYPINDVYAQQQHAPNDRDSFAGNVDPVYVKKLEYSADKFQKNLSKKNSASKRSSKKQDRSVKLRDKSHDYFEIQKSNRKNTLSGHKRTKHVQSKNDFSEESKSSI